MKLSSYAKQIGIHYNTAWRMWKRGQIPGYLLPTGTVIIDPPEQQPRTTPSKQQIVAVSAHVSSSEKKENLDMQAERLISWCNAQGWSVGKVVKECGSGINEQRPRFLAMQGRELLVVSTADTAQDDLMGDFVAIITSFAARMYGRRRAKRKIEQVLAALEQDGS